jgi:hypothetical protein
MDILSPQSQTWLGVLSAAVLLALGYAATRYFIPWLRVGSRRKYAEYIAFMADEVTDDLRRRYPASAWAEHLDEAVDRLIEICRIKSEVAQRAVNAAAARK